MGILENKVIVVLGASSGIGAAMSEYFLEHKAIVHLAARRLDRLQQITQDMQDKGYRASYSVCDATRYEDVQQVVAEVLQQYGRVDLWINCVGQNKAIGKLWELDVQEVWDEIDVNLHSCMNGTHAVLQHMVAENRGVVVNFCGGGTAQPHLYAGAYSASKTAVARFTEATMKEVEKDKLAIRIFCVNPGLVYNERTAELCESEAGKRFMPDIEVAFAEGRCQSALIVTQFIEQTLTGALDNYAGRLVEVPSDVEELRGQNEYVKGSLKGLLRIVH